MFLDSLLIQPLLFYIMAIQVVEFSNGDIKLERFFPKNQHTKRKFSNILWRPIYIYCLPNLYNYILGIEVGITVDIIVRSSMYAIRIFVRPFFYAAPLYNSSMETHNHLNF